MVGLCWSCVTEWSGVGRYFLGVGVAWSYCDLMVRVLLGRGWGGDVRCGAAWSGAVKTEKGWQCGLRWVGVVGGAGGGGGGGGSDDDGGEGTETQTTTISEQKSTIRVASE